MVIVSVLFSHRLSHFWKLRVQGKDKASFPILFRRFCFIKKLPFSATSYRPLLFSKGEFQVNDAHDHNLRHGLRENLQTVL